MIEKSILEFFGPNLGAVIILISIVGIMTLVFGLIVILGANAFSKRMNR